MALSCWSVLGSRVVLLRIHEALAVRPFDGAAVHALTTSVLMEAVPHYASADQLAANFLVALCLLRRLLVVIQAFIFFAHGLLVLTKCAREQKEVRLVICSMIRILLDQRYDVGVLHLVIER